MAFSTNDLLLSADRSAQLTKALANLGVADPLLYICEEAAADVARMTTGYVLDEASMRNFVRSLALFRIYAKAGPVPEDVQRDYDSALKELEAIAKGERPNLPKVPVEGQATIVGKWGSKTYVAGRLEPPAS